MFDIEYENIEGETNHAWLIDLGLDGIHWFPKSECQIDEDNMTIAIPQWMAEDKGFV